jgi:hypothetical protein
MKKWTIAGLGLLAPLAAAQESHAYVNYPWCARGEARNDCVYKSKEQCAQGGRSNGFGSMCVANPSYNPNLPPVLEIVPAKKPAGQPCGRAQPC